MQGLIKPVLEEGRLKSIKIIIPSYLPAHGVRKSLFGFCSFKVWMSRTFVYDAVNINKIVIVSSTKPPARL